MGCANSANHVKSSSKIHIKKLDEICQGYIKN